MTIERRLGALAYNPNRVEALKRRYEVVKALKPSIDDAAAKLAQLITGRHRMHEFSLRRRFVYRDDAASRRWSDRRVPPPEEQPPVGRIVSANGIAPKVMLMALFEAQTRTPRERSPENHIRLCAGGDQVGWIDLFAVPAEGQGSGRTRSSPDDLKIRRLRSALQRLAAPDTELVFLPGAGCRTETYEGFLLNDEGGHRANASTIRYRVPRQDEPGLFSLPAGLITRGWIHLLTHAELRLLMMIADQEATMGTDQVRVPGDLRLGHYGLGWDAYESNLLLEERGLFQVEEQQRHRDSKIVNFSKKYAEPHMFRLRWDGFDQYAVDMVTHVLSRL
jgi:hypothetical protein